METIGHILPIALAVAFSSLPIMVTIVVLLSPARSRAALPFLIGWTVGILVLVSVSALLAQFIPTPRSERQPDTAVGIFEIVVGGALIALAVFSWRRAVRHPSPAMPAWLRARGTLGPWEALGAGLLLNIRPKGLLLAMAGGLTIRADAPSLAVAVVAIVVYTVVGASTVAIPIVATLAAPARMEPRLVRSQEWLARNGGIMTSLILLVIGVVILGSGLIRL